MINALSYSEAPFKFIAIGGQVLSSGAVYENYANYPEERKYLLDKIREAKIEGVIFLDGDRHHSVLSKMQENKDVTVVCMRRRLTIVGEKMIDVTGVMVV